MITETRDSLNAFDKLVMAALTLGVGGLKGDRDSITEAIGGRPFQFDVPYSDGRSAIHTRGGCGWGASKMLLELICEHSGAIAPYQAACLDQEAIETEFGVTTVYAPRSVSAHELLEAGGLLSDALIAWGKTPEQVEGLLTLR